ncbi:PE-PPE domain-containing protein [Mycolicibacterium austroafricanum]|nr:PE-PPE domain-containing protein [Mycolicibacterium austroafricanum]
MTRLTCCSSARAEQEDNGMVVVRRCLVSLIALACVLLGIGTVAGPVGAAERAVLIPGASPFKPINPFFPIIAATYPYIGINLHDDADPQVVDYSQNPFSTDRALLQGLERAEVAVREIDGKAVVIGESMGSMVASRLAADLSHSPDPPSTDDIRFVLIASPEEGMAQYFKEGTRIPLLNYTVSRVAQSPYPTTVIVGEYDGWADPPDRPWNLVAVANSAMALLYVHGPASWDIDLDDVPPENITVDGTVTRYFVPTEHLPLTRPFRDIGVPDCVVDAADQILRPIIDAGYHRHDQPGDSRPYLYDGRIHRDGDDDAGGEKETEVAAPTRQAGGDGRLDRDDPDVSDSADDPDVRESAEEPHEREAAEDPEASEPAEESDARETTDDPAQRQEVGG